MRPQEQLSFSIQNADALSCPVILSVPHAGRLYPRALTENLRVPGAALLRLEDRYADLLVRDASESGFTTLIAHRPRAWIDLNRAPDDVDADMLSDRDTSQFPQKSRKVRAGLGLIPRSLADYGELWQRKWKWAAISERIEQDHRSYHDTLDALLRQALRKFGIAILLDVHSMPTIAPKYDVPGAQIVVGDRYGHSASGGISAAVQSCATASGYRTQLNHPYAGGYILERHARPKANIHGIQLEVGRELYLDESRREPNGNVGKIAGLVRDIACLLADEAGGNASSIAAE